MDTLICLETKRLILRNHTINDLHSYHKLLSDKDTMYYLKDIKTSSLEDSKTNLINVIEDASSNNRRNYFFRIENKVTKAYIGEIGYTVTGFTPLGKLVDLGYFIFPKFWNKGYVTEAVKEVIQFAFVDNNVFRISAGCIKDNKGSERVMQKCGMIKEAEFKMKVWYKGKMRDRVSYRLLKNEWMLNCIK